MKKKRRKLLQSFRLLETNWANIHSKKLNNFLPSKKNRFSKVCIHILMRLFPHSVQCNFSINFWVSFIFDDCWLWCVYFVFLLFICIGGISTTWEIALVSGKIFSLALLNLKKKKQHIYVYLAGVYLASKCYLQSTYRGSIPFKWVELCSFFLCVPTFDKDVLQKYW